MRWPLQIDDRDREEHHVHRVHDRDLEHFLLGTTSQLDVTHKFYLVTGE